ncbi:hypothetical protein SAMN04488067_11186 [Halorubrum xinjiangense]|uniref:DUF8112 domain-containing protein n=1 Tax=Halorubrum xinjiangense TaxID=261291 RepID=A0A1G7Q8N4_9EURY|nr:hypothetical protein [Halorubrum xinjiangense]SDF94876.1 hypothetical protein SAMN04488067_11186 [Halorubrum xinjiangense]
MEHNNPQTEDGTGDELIEDISKIQYIALGEGPAACQICGRELREGDELTAYAFRAAGNPIFEIGYVMCRADEHAHPTEFMRGVHELVVTGRIGLCTDVATQSSWLVLLAPEPIVASRPTSTDAYTIGEETTRESDPLHTHQATEADPTQPFEDIHERGSTQLEGTTEHTADYSQRDGTHQAEHNEQTHQHATNQGGEE